MTDKRDTVSPTFLPLKDHCTGRMSCHSMSSRSNNHKMSFLSPSDDEVTQFDFALSSTTSLISCAMGRTFQVRMNVSSKKKEREEEKKSFSV